MMERMNIDEYRRILIVSIIAELACIASLASLQLLALVVSLYRYISLITAAPGRYFAFLAWHGGLHFIAAVYSVAAAATVWAQGRHGLHGLELLPAHLPAMLRVAGLRDATAASRRPQLVQQGLEQ